MIIDKNVKIEWFLEQTHENGLAKNGLDKYNLEKGKVIYATQKFWDQKYTTPKIVENYCNSKEHEHERDRT